MGTVKDKACPDRQRDHHQAQKQAWKAGKEPVAEISSVLFSALQVVKSPAGTPSPVNHWRPPSKCSFKHAFRHQQKSTQEDKSIKMKSKKKQIAQKPNKDILVNYESYLLIAKVIMKWCPPCYYSLSLQNHSLYSSVTIKQTLTEDRWAPSANTEIKGAEAEQSPTGNFRVKKHPRGTTKYSTNLTACSSLFHVCIPSSLPLLPFYQQG